MKRVKPKKFLGQHFLKDFEISKKIVENLNYKKINAFIEIGPGMGVLTQHLLKKNIDGFYIEIDNESFKYLKKLYPTLGEKLILEDFLKINLEDFNGPLGIIGNFPYNISSQILFKTFENRDQITEIVGMFQKEVAERIACKKGKKRGILSVFLQAFYEVEYCFTVNEDVFTPSPRVKSGVIKLLRNTRKELSVNENKFKRIVKAAFNQRRKTLRNALKPFTLIRKEEIANFLTLRAEQLSVDDFIKLTQHVR